MIGRRRAAAGFTLIEVLSALVIFGIAIVGFMRAMGESARIQSDLAMQQRALMLAQNVLEELRTAGDYELGEEEGAFEGEDALYAWHTDVRRDENVDGLLDVGVTIAWNDGTPRQLALATQVSGEGS